MRDKLQFIPFWKITDWGFHWSFLLPSFGWDEFHNKSFRIIIPLVGEFVWFFTTDRDGPEHLYGFSNGEPEGYIDPQCDICEMILFDL